MSTCTECGLIFDETAVPAHYHRGVQGVVCGGGTR